MSVEDVPQGEAIEELDVVEPDQPKLELEQPQSERVSYFGKRGLSLKRYASVSYLEKF